MDHLTERPSLGFPSQNGVNISGGRISRSSLSRSLDDVIFIKKSELVIRKRIGKGSFGTVYKGRFYGKDVAVKVLTVQNSVSRVGWIFESDTAPSERLCEAKRKQLEDLVSNLEKEVRVLKSLSFASIVKFYGVCLDPASIITEYCAHQSLFDFIASARNDPDLAATLTWEKRLLIAHDVARGMEYLHDRKCSPVLHRDLKSPNLLLDDELNCKICDFNTSRFVVNSVVTNSIAANNPHWLAPEVLQGMPFSRESDVYPFGTILWELMTWKFPYETHGEPRHPAAVLFGTVFKNERPDIPPNKDLIGGECPVYCDYCDLITRCWKRTPKKRPAFSDIVRILEGLLRRIRAPLLQGLQILTDADRLELDWPDSPRSFGQDSIRSDRPLQRLNQFGKSSEASVELLGEQLLPSAKKLPFEDSPVEQKGLSPFSTVSRWRLPGARLRAKLSAIGGDYRKTGMSEQSRKASNSARSTTSSHSSYSTDTVTCPANTSTARCRWDRIRNVVNLMTAQRLRDTLPQESQGLENDEGRVIDCTASSTVTSGQLSPVQELEQDAVEGEMPQNRSKGNGWNVIRTTMLPDAAPRNSLWISVVDHLAAKTTLHQSASMGTACFLTDGEPYVESRAKSYWNTVKVFFLEKDLKGYPRTPPHWQCLLEFLLPDGVHEEAMPQQLRRSLKRAATSKEHSRSPTNPSGQGDALVQRYKDLTDLAVNKEGAVFADGSAELLMAAYQISSLSEDTSASERGSFLTDFLRD